MVLFTAHIDGKSIPAAAITPKSPWVYAVNRETGKPIWPGKEEKVPQAPENKTWPTQWIPSYKPLVPMVITDKEFKEASEQIRASEAIPNAKTIKIQRPPNNDPAADVYTPSGTKVGAAVVIGPPVGGTGWAPMSYSPETNCSTPVARKASASARRAPSTASSSRRSQPGRPAGSDQLQPAGLPRGGRPEHR